MRPEPQLEEELGEAGHQAHDAQPARIVLPTQRSGRPLHTWLIIARGRIKIAVRGRIK
jgi:hypothetical protein